MTTRTRYFILVICIIIFLGLAPSLILYAKGQKLDRENKKVVNTGIISVRTNPKGVKVFIDGQESGETPLSARFITAGQHTIEIKSPQTKTWKKQLLVEAGRVTRIGDTSNPIVLIKESQANIVAKDIIDFKVIDSEKIAYLSNQKALIFFNTKTLKTEKTIAVPDSVVSFTMDTTGNIILLFNDKGEQISGLNLKNNTNIPKLGLEISEMIKQGEESLWYQKTDKLYEYDIKSNIAKVIKENVLAAQAEDNKIYALTQKDNHAEISFASNGEEFAPLISDLVVPPSKNIKLFVSPQKQIFLLADTDLYKLASVLEKITDNISSVEITGSGLVLYSPGETKFYNSDNEKLALISRDTQSQAITQARLIEGGYFVTFKNQKITATEMDDRDSKQIYDIAPATEARSLTPSPDNRWIYWIDEGDLNRIELIK